MRSLTTCAHAPQTSGKGGDAATLPRMRRAALAVLTTLVVGCSGSPPPGASGEASGASNSSSLTKGEEGPAGLSESESQAEANDDPLLTQARAQIRQGRVSPAMQAKLAASTNPDHRHAARLLQQVAGTTPAPILSRARDGGLVEEVDPKPNVVAIEDSAPAPKPPIKEVAEAEVEPIALPKTQPKPAADPTDPRPPRVEDFAPGTPAHVWFGDAPAGPESAKPDEAQPWSWPEIEPERSILLRERAPEEPETRPGSPRRYPEAARLVILTSLTLSRAPDGRSAMLEFAGAGGIELDVLPIDDYHLRLSVVGAGAVPGFLEARPALEGLEVVEVSRYERIIDVELEHGPGWVLVGSETRANGAVATLVYVEPPVPSEQSAEQSDEDAQALVLDEDAGDSP